MTFRWIIQAASTTAIAGLITAPVPAESLTASTGPRTATATSVVVVLEVETGPCDGVVYQFGITASAHSPSMW